MLKLFRDCVNFNGYCPLNVVPGFCVIRPVKTKQEVTFSLSLMANQKTDVSLIQGKKTRCRLAQLDRVFIETQVIFTVK